MKRRINVFLVRYNVLISLCAVSLLGYFSIITKIHVSALYYVLTFFSTLSLYNMYRLFPNIISFRAYKRSLGIELILYGVTITAITFSLISDSLKYLYLVPFIITIIYKFPIILKKELRQIPFLKVVIVALVWVLIGLIPFLHDEIKSPENLKLFFPQFLFFIAITIPFDIFDVKIDTIKTTANLFGVNKSLFLAKVFLILFLVSALLLPLSFNIKVSHIIVSIVAFVVLLNLKNLKSKAMQYYFVDGLIIFQLLLVYVFSKLENMS
ncbi:MAG: hypothetical protein JSU07_07480 [Bacteroidetes bacterium]|nr:hypothetical protein [Bacteroidota bacterium]